MKNLIKAVSFDMWNTLLKNNPNYRIERTKYIADNSDMDPKDIAVTLDLIKKDIDAGVEKFGFQYDHVSVYQMIKTQTGFKGTRDELIMNFIDIFKSNMPTLMPGVETMLEDLSREHKLYLASNTVLINGTVIREVLDKHDISKYFETMLFSNELGFSKPDPNFYRILHMRTGQLREQILHVGDNQITDYDGARNYGMRAHLIEDSITQFHEIFKNFYTHA